MRRGLWLVLAILCVVLGVLAIAGGSAVAAIFGSDGTIASAPTRVSGSGVAVIADGLEVDPGSVPVPDGLGTLTVTFASPTRGSVFVGTAGAADVDTYLIGAPYDVVVTLAPGETAETRAVPGTQQPAVPGDQTFWQRQATGSPATLAATVEEGSTLVVMNADATPGVTVDAVVTLTVSRAWSSALTAIGVGVALLLVAVAAFWRAAVARRRAEASAGRHATPGPAGTTVLPGDPPGAAEPASAAAVPAPAVPAPAVAVDPVAARPSPPAAASGSNVKVVAGAVPPVDDPDPELAPSDPSDAEDGLAPRVGDAPSNGG